MNLLVSTLFIELFEYKWVLYTYIVCVHSINIPNEKYIVSWFLFISMSIWRILNTVAREWVSEPLLTTYIKSQSCKFMQIE